VTMRMGVCENSHRLPDDSPLRPTPIRLDRFPTTRHTPAPRMLLPEMDSWDRVAPVRVTEDSSGS
jgi:hypothetical protein